MSMGGEVESETSEHENYEEHGQSSYPIGSDETGLSEQTEEVSEDTADLQQTLAKANETNSFDPNFEPDPIDNMYRSTRVSGIQVSRPESSEARPAVSQRQEIGR